MTLQKEEREASHSDGNGKELDNNIRIGYARVSTTAQNLVMQIEALNKAGCEKIYTEKESGVKERPVLKELLSFIRQGDTLVVYKLDSISCASGNGNISSSRRR